MATNRLQQLKLTTTGISTFITGNASAGSLCLNPMIFKVVGTSSASSMLKVYINNGTTRTLFRELYIPPITASDTQQSVELRLYEPWLFLVTNTHLIEVEMSTDIGAVDCTTVVSDL